MSARNILHRSSKEVVYMSVSVDITDELLAATKGIVQNASLGVVTDSLSLEDVSSGVAGGKIIGLRYLYLSACELQASLLADEPEIVLVFAPKESRFFNLRDLVVAPGRGGECDFTATTFVPSDQESDQDKRSVHVRFHVPVAGRVTFTRLS